AFERQAEARLVEAGALGRGLGIVGEEAGDAERVEIVDQKLDGNLGGAGADGGFKNPAGGLAAETRANGVCRGLERERAGLENRDGEEPVGAQLIETEIEGFEKGGADDVDTGAVGREDVEVF